MTLFTFIKQCLRMEAARTEPDCTKALEKLLKALEKGQNEQKDRPP